MTTIDDQTTQHKLTARQLRGLFIMRIQSRDQLTGPQTASNVGSHYNSSVLTFCPKTQYYFILLNILLYYSKHISFIYGKKVQVIVFIHVLFSTSSDPEILLAEDARKNPCRQFLQTGEHKQ